MNGVASWLEEARASYGREGDAEVARDPVNPAMIRHWCDAMGDHNPVYTDPERAARSLHGALVAPPAMLNAWTMPGLSRRPDATSRPVFSVYRALDAAGFTSVVATDSEHEYLRYLRVGDLLHGMTLVEDISEQKQTALGRGHFVTTNATYRTQTGEVVGRMRMRILKFMPGTGRAPAGGDRVAASAPTDASAAPSKREDLPAPTRRDATLGAGEVKAGDALAPCLVPITTTRIVAGAIASRDYQDVHHDRDLAKLRGSPDIFMNILTTSGLSARYVTDWAGPEALLRRLSLRLGAPNYPGDAMLLSGRVSAVERAGEGARVDVAFEGRNRLGAHVTGTVELALPAQARVAL